MASFNTSTRRKDDVSLKLRVSNLRNAEEQTKKLETDSRQMEERLHELKIAMMREKEERDQSQGGFWKAGQTGNLGGYAKDVLNKPVKPKGSKPRKVRVLKDEPAVVPERHKGPGTMGHIAQKGVGGATGKENKFKGPKCGQCEEKEAQVSCVECGEDYCAPCFAGFHLRGNLKKHRSVPFGSKGSRTPRGMVTPRKGATSIPGKSPDTSPNSQMVALSQPTIQEDPPVENGGSLMDGAYNETDSAAAFQDALKAWRNPAAINDVQQTKKVSPAKMPVASSECSTSTDTPNGIQSPWSQEIKFSQSLSYAEKLLLKKHRRKDLNPLPDDPLDTRSRLDNHDDVRTSRSDSHLLNHYEETAIEFLRDPHETIEDGDELKWRDIHRAMKENTFTHDDPRAESRVSIIELDDEEEKPTRSKSSLRQKRPDQTSQYTVSEVGMEEDKEILTSRQNSASQSRPRQAFVSSSATKRESHKQGKSNPDSARSRNTNRPESNTSKTPNKTPAAQNKNIPTSAKMSKSSSDKDVDLSIDLNQNKDKSSRPKSSARVKSARAKSSRTGQSRPQSRAMSRAETRLALFGEGELTKAPSDALRDVARMTPRVDHNSYLPTMSDFFTGGVITPEEVRDKVMTPSKQRSSSKTNASDADAGIPKYKVSYNLYNMAPRSWRPGTSLQETVPDQDALQTMDEIAPHLREFNKEDEENMIETMSYSISDGLSIHTENSITDSQTAGTASNHQSTRSKSAASKTKNTTPRDQVTARSSSKTTLPSSGANDLDLTPRPENDSDLTPRPESRAIVVDGDDMSCFDGPDDEMEQNDEDDEALNQLEWELASQDGRITEDGTMSRMSTVMPEEDEETEGDSTLEEQDQALSVMLEGALSRGLASPGASYDHRVKNLMEDFEEMEREVMDEQEVKQLR